MREEGGETGGGLRTERRVVQAVVLPESKGIGRECRNQHLDEVVGHRIRPDRGLCKRSFEGGGVAPPCEGVRPRHEARHDVHAHRGPGGLAVVHRRGGLEEL